MKFDFRGIKTITSNMVKFKVVTSPSVRQPDVFSLKIKYN